MARNEDIKALYQEKLKRINSHDKHLWNDLVHSIEVDPTLQEAPKVHSDKQVEQRAGAQKRRARDQYGPVGHTPNSAERKTEERRQ